MITSGGIGGLSESGGLTPNGVGLRGHVCRSERAVPFRVLMGRRVSDRATEPRTRLERAGSAEAE
jgi:hypothetical protein